jgi:microcystin-dependent protein
MKSYNYLALLVLLSQVAFAGVPTSFTYEGKVLNSAGTAPLTSVVSLTLSLYDPSGTCLLYQEQQANIDLSQTNGLFAVQVGSAVGATKRTGLDQGLTLATIFANNGQIVAASTTNCSAGYTPATNDIRVLRVQVTNGGSTVTITPDLQINSVPNAMVAETVQGLTATQIYVPVGFVLPTFLSTCPTGYLSANGQSVLKSTYPALFAAFGTTYGGTTTNFSVPDTRGYFLRGLDTSGAIDPNGTGRTVGNVEQDSMQGHTHTWIGNNVTGISGSGPYTFSGGGSAGTVVSGSNSGPVSDGVNGTPRTGLETRPKNLAVNYCIKY